MTLIIGKPVEVSYAPIKTVTHCRPLM